MTRVSGVSREVAAKEEHCVEEGRMWTAIVRWREGTQSVKPVFVQAKLANMSMGEKDPHPVCKNHLEIAHGLRGYTHRS